MEVLGFVIWSFFFFWEGGSREVAEAAAEVVKWVKRPTGTDPQRCHLISDGGLTVFH